MEVMQCGFIKKLEKLFDLYLNDRVRKYFGAINFLFCQTI